MGGFPNEFLLYQMYSNNAMDKVPSSFFVYIALMAVVTLVSIVAQMRDRANNQEAYSLRPRSILGRKK